MIRSMTGYGSAELERDGQRLTAEIRSVNHRFCEVSLRAPKLVSLFEDQIRQLIQDRFSRGKFNLTITWCGRGRDAARCSRSTSRSPTATSALLEQLRERYQLDSGLDVRTLADAARRVHLGAHGALGRGDLGAGEGRW